MSSYRRSVRTLAINVAAAPCRISIAVQSNTCCRLFRLFKTLLFISNGYSLFNNGKFHFMIMCCVPRDRYPNTVIRSFFVDNLYTCTTLAQMVMLTRLVQKVGPYSTCTECNRYNDSYRRCSYQVLVQSGASFPQTQSKLRFSDLRVS